jgi:hypothetical protein
MNITPAGIIRCLQEIRDAGGALVVVNNPPQEREPRGGIGIVSVKRAGGLSATERVATFRSAAGRGLISAHPGKTDEHGNRRQVLELTPLGEDVLDGRAPMPRGPGEPAHDSELGLAGQLRKAARAQAEHERLQREIAGGEA